MCAIHAKYVLTVIQSISISCWYVYYECGLCKYVMAVTHVWKSRDACVTYGYDVNL